MDTAETEIMKRVSENNAIQTRRLREALLDMHFNQEDVDEAIKSLEKMGLVSRIEPLGEENLTFTRTGKQQAEKMGLL